MESESTRAACAWETRHGARVVLDSKLLNFRHPQKIRPPKKMKEDKLYFQTQIMYSVFKSIINLTGTANNTIDFLIFLKMFLMLGFFASPAPYQHLVNKS